MNLKHKKKNAKKNDSELPGSIDETVVRVIILGNHSVGKTSYIKSLVGETVRTNYFPTIGIDYSSMDLEIKGNNVHIQLWDTAGQERFHTINPLYFRNAVGCIFAFDCGDRGSFEKLTQWMESVSQFRSPKDLAWILISTKEDLYSEHGVGLPQVSSEEIQEFCDKYKFEFFRTSAFIRQNVEESMKHLVSEIIERGLHVENKTHLESPKIKEFKPNHSKKKCCK